jgi:hypothetical protein
MSQELSMVSVLMRLVIEMTGFGGGEKWRSGSKSDAQNITIRAHEA